MHRRRILPVLFLLLTGCSRPVPPGTHMALLHPPEGAVTGPEVTLLIRALAWGPGVLADLGDPLGGTHYVSSVPVRPLAIRVRVDGKRVRELAGGNYYRLTLHLPPGRHVLEIEGGLRRIRTTVQVRDPPPLRFVPTASPTNAAIPAGLEAHLRQPLAPDADLRLLRSGRRLLAAVHQHDRWRIWRLPPDASALEEPPLLEIPSAPASMAKAVFVACGEGFVVAGYPTSERRVLHIWRIPETGAARRLASLPGDRLAADVVHRTGGFDTGAFLSGLQCFGAHVLFALPGHWHVRIEGDNRWRITADPGPILPLPDGRWLQLDTRAGVARVEGRDGAVALPLPPRPRTWRAEGPFPLGVFGVRPQWRVLPGWPPRLAVAGAHPADEAVFLVR